MTAPRASGPLKPCPFCGNKYPARNSSFPSAWCPGCTLSFTPEGWNTRPIESALLSRAEAAEAKLEKVREWAYEMLPDCSCSKGYTVRRLVDPSCHYHDSDVETLYAILAPGGGEGEQP